MSFEAEWLALREPADRAARDPALLAAAVQVAEGGWVLDLGCGTGSTARAFASVGGRVAGWRLFDGDARLLAEAVARTPGAEGVEGDLADLPALPLEGIGLVTASALLDLVSHAWIEGLAARLAEAGVGFYAALSVDGRMAWDPPFPQDAAIAAAFARHQARDKGLGLALGPLAPNAAAAAFARCGFSVRTAPSDWRLGPSDGGLQAAFAAGVAAAAAEAGCPDAAAWVQACSARPRTCVVGHVDLLALPPCPSTQSKTTSRSSP